MIFKWIERRVRRIIPRPIRRLATWATIVALVVLGQPWLAAALAATQFVKKPSAGVNDVLDRLNLSIDPQALESGCSAKPPPLRIFFTLRKSATIA
jgi:hypothetical protein